ncbi:MAG: GTP-binding protein, partial [Thiohalomonadales bacterium]
LQELLDDQLAAADLVILSKDDLLSEQQRQRVEGIVTAKIAKHVKMIATEHGKIDNRLILGLAAASEDRIEGIHTHHDHHHAHAEHHRHAHDDFDSVSIQLAEVDSDKLLLLLQQLIAENVIYRIKGILAIKGKPMRQVIQGVGGRIDRYFDRLWTEQDTRQSKVVVIGKDLHNIPFEEILSQAIAS